MASFLFNKIQIVKIGKRTKEGQQNGCVPQGTLSGPNDFDSCKSVKDRVSTM